MNLNSFKKRRTDVLNNIDSIVNSPKIRYHILQRSIATVHESKHPEIYKILNIERSGLEAAKPEETEQIDRLLNSKVKQLTDSKATQKKADIQFDKNTLIFFNLNPDKDESNALAQLPKHADIAKTYGFVSPAVIEIEDGVDFFMTRYEKQYPELKTNKNKRENKLIENRRGAIAEKVFHYILQNMASPVNYPDRTRDWRGYGVPFSQPVDFEIPSFGKVEIKSVTEYREDKGRGKLIDYRINVNKSEWSKTKPDYLVALWHIGKNIVVLCGAMSAETVNNSKYDAPYTGGPFWSIPLSDVMNSITATSLYLALHKARQNVVATPLVTCTNQ